MSHSEHPNRAKITDYRAKAVEAAERASATKDLLTRTSWEQIASSYYDMAERLERNIVARQNLFR